jgi:hypothetical protein
MKKLLAGVAALFAAVGLAAPGTAAAGTLQFTNVGYDVTPDRLSGTTREPVRMRK